MTSPLSCWQHRSVININRHVISAALSIGVVLSAAFAIVAVATRGTPVKGAVNSPLGAAASPQWVASPTPTIAVGATATIANGLQALAQQNSQWPKFVAAVETANVNAVMGFFEWHPHACTPASSHGGSAPTCAQLGVADGSELQMFPEDYRGALPLPTGTGLWYGDRSTVNAGLTQLLQGRHAKLELVARDSRGNVYLSFPVDQAPHPISGAPVVSVSFLIPDPAAASVRSFAEGVASTTPFEVLRGLQRAGNPYQVLGVSSQLLQREQAIHRERYASPAHNATPSGP